MRKLLLIFVLTLLFVQSIFAQKAIEQKSWDEIYDTCNVIGTTVLLNENTNELKVFNKERSDSMFLPASTFKILNSLIALQTGAVKSINDTIRWDGVDRGWSEWNKDQTMKTALPVSCVWFYQELARRIGREKMQKWVDSVGYGNQKLGPEIDKFWLDGDMRISAIQQVLFIEKLINDKLPFDIEIQKTVKEIMVTDSTANYILHSKTGWAMRVERQIGWFVGYVKTEKGKWIFATNIDISKKSDLEYRSKITYEILKYEGIIE